MHILYDFDTQTCVYICVLDLNLGTKLFDYSITFSNYDQFSKAFFIHNIPIIHQCLSCLDIPHSLQTCILRCVHFGHSGE